MAQNEMRAKPALPERVRSMEGLGVDSPPSRRVLKFGLTKELKPMTFIQVS